MPNNTVGNEAKIEDVLFHPKTSKTPLNVA